MNGHRQSLALKFHTCANQCPKAHHHQPYRSTAGAEGRPRTRKRTAVRCSGTDRVQSHRSMISDFYATLSPVKRIPDEALALIFEHRLPMRSPDDPFTFLGRARDLTLVQLGLVCSSWRGAAHASPRLWCNVNLYIHETSSRIDADSPLRILSSAVAHPVVPTRVGM
ncbi:uncharacterized protein EDB91DRAFT_1185155 [Suillus paluster]|uniref:uncharacterized protein n=1 Tax=Suillus paluster TaxID=48578 RepID=UPI001B886F6D|nr:uncharacterized protein EDB91DRAFT_1185155 [Suillus paluster]KAG1718508.1 hypothetical protein EDB91DRAFT_1185155 [Suillus paluster]